MISSGKLTHGIGLIRPEQVTKLIAFHLVVVDFAIGWGRKIGGLAALAGLGWMSITQPWSSQPANAIVSPANDPELRRSIVMALLLVVSQGWDMPSGMLLMSWARLKSYFPTPVRYRSTSNDTRRSLTLPLAFRRKFILVFTFFELCVALANKIGALAFAVYLIYFLDKLFFEGSTLRQMYPDASDPFVSVLADICVYVVIISWWATPMSRIVYLWRHLRKSFEGG